MWARRKGIPLDEYVRQRDARKAAEAARPKRRYTRRSRVVEPTPDPDERRTDGLGVGKVSKAIARRRAEAAERGAKLRAAWEREKTERRARRAAELGASHAS